jgi:hypothetical protein
MVLLCWTELLAMLIADYLSHHTFRWPVLGTFNSNTRFLTHNRSLRINDIVMYSASNANLDTTYCFLLFHDTRSPPTKIQYPVVDLMCVVVRENM